MRLGEGLPPPTNGVCVADFASVSAARPQRTLVMISSAVLCQMKGLGASFQRSAHSSIASMSAPTRLKVPRRSRRSVSRWNQPSTRFSHDDDVGVTCRCHRCRLG